MGTGAMLMHAGRVGPEAITRYIMQKMCAQWSNWYWRENTLLLLLLLLLLYSGLYQFTINLITAVND
jgi:hypothetical protein